MSAETKMGGIAKTGLGLLKAAIPTVLGLAIYFQVVKPFVIDKYLVKGLPVMDEEEASDE